MRCWRNAMAGLLAVGVAGGFASIARADLPQSVRESTTADQSRDAIDKYVAGLIDHIKAANKDSGAAREELARQPESNAVFVPSSSFQTVYNSAVMNNINVLLNSKDVTQRLNGAIVIWRLCNANRTAQLLPVVEQLMKDPAAPVALWGVKAAGQILPAILNSPLSLKNQHLTTEIVDTVKAHGDIGAIIQDAYSAINLADLQPALPQPALQACIDAMNGLLAIRVTEWQKGVPQSPRADQTAAIFFARGVITSAMTKPQHVQTVQQLLNMLTVTSQQAIATNTSDLFRVPEAYAGVLKVQFDKQANIASQFEPLQRLPGMLNAASITQRIADATKAIRSMPDYATIKDLPPSQAKAG